MTNPAPWTANGQPETNKTRTWWIVGAVVLAVLVAYVAFLAGRGWDDATAVAKPDPVPASGAPLEVTQEVPALLQCGKSMACIGINKQRLEEIESAIFTVQPREASVGLSEAVADWQRAYSVFSTQWCTQESSEECSGAVADMDDAVSVMQQIVG